MYPYLRLFGITFSNLRRTTFVTMDQEISTTFHVSPLDLDTNFHMNNGRYLTIMDLARFDFIGKTGMLKPVFKNRWYPVVGAAQMVYLKSLKCFQKYTIYTALECWDEKWFIIKQRFETNGKLVAYGRIRGLIRSRAGNIAPSEVLKASGVSNLISPQPSEAVQLWLTGLASEKNSLS